MIKNIALLLAAIAAIYMLIALAVSAYQKNLIHIPYQERTETPLDRGLPFETVRLINALGNGEIHGWFVPNDRSQLTAYMFSGNAGNISYMLDNIEILHQLDLSVFIYDYRSFGPSTGKLTEDTMYSDAEAGWQYLTETRQIPSHRIIVYGRSLGGAMATAVAAKNEPAAVILESTFTSMEAMAKRIYPWLPARLLLRWRYDNLSRITQIQAPVLLIHSPDDELVPYAHSEALYAAARAPKTLAAISGGHIRGFLESGEIYIESIRSFIAAHTE